MNTVKVSVVYAVPDAATEVELNLAGGATVGDALRSAELASRHPEIDFTRCALGIFGRRVNRDTVLNDGDRVEIYRPLLADPKDSRRLRAEKRKRRSG